MWYRRQEKIKSDGARFEHGQRAHAPQLAAWVGDRTTKIIGYLAWKIPCTLVQGASIGVLPSLPEHEE